MADLSALTPITTTATSLSNLVLVSPQATIGYQPLNPPLSDGTASTQQPPPAFLFHYEGEQSVTLESDITDHYIEDNTALQDQISIRPPIITTHGFIGELNNVAPLGLQTAKTIANKLTIVGAYAPGLSVTALTAYNTAFQLYQVAINAINSGVSAWSSINGVASESVISGQAFSVPVSIAPNQNKQQMAFQTLYGYWQNRTLFTVQTPWAVFQNMAIKSMRPVQDAETNSITSFEMSFKQIRIAQASTGTATVGSGQQGRASTQSAGLQDLGTSTPAPGMSLQSGLSSSYGVA